MIDVKIIWSVRVIPITDIVVDTLQTWKEKQTNREKTNKNVTADLTAPTSYVFSNDDGSVRTYSGCRMIFDRFIKRHNLGKYNIHFHGLRHTFSNMLFEMNENPKAIQQLLGHRDVKTTITIYNSVDNEYIRNTTEKLNEKIKHEKLYEDEKRRQEEIKTKKNDLLSNMTDEEYDDLLEQLLEERKLRKKKEKDCEMWTQIIMAQFSEYIKIQWYNANIGLKIIYFSTFCIFKGDLI